MSTASVRPARAWPRGGPRAVVAAALPAAGLLGAVAVVVAGLWIKDTAGGLGTPLPPFLMSWRPQLDPLVAVSVAVLGAGVLAAPILIARVRSRLTFACALYLLALALALSLNVARAGAAGWWKVFATGSHGSFEGSFEYLPALPLLRHGTGYYLSHFASLFPYLTTHVKGNPPGPLVALHLLGVGSPGGLAALCIGLGAFSAPLAYELGRTLGDEQRGRIAGTLSAFSPSILLFGVTSVDYAYVTIGLVVACLLARGGAAALVAGSIAAAFASFFSWLLLAIPAWSAILALRRSGWRRAAAVLGAVALSVVALNAVLALGYGYDPLGALRATDAVYRRGVAATRPYSFWLFGSPAAWMLMLGLPVAWLGLRSVSVADPAAIALWALVLVASLLGFTKAETERIWLPFVPLACVAAAAATPAWRLRSLLGALAAQALVIELLFFTVW